VPDKLLTDAATALAAGMDAFEETGIIVVGSAKLSDPRDSGSELVPADYSQYGPGLFCLAPSDRDEDPSARPPADGNIRYNYVPAPDILGHGGYAAEPSSLVSGHSEEYGFGGTSAASAQAAGVIARLIEARRASGEAVDGPAVRAAIARRLGPYRSEREGYGLLTV